MGLVRKQEVRFTISILILIVAGFLLTCYHGGSMFLFRREIAVLSRNVGQRVIVIDPGHGGLDGGATGPSGVTEEDVVLGVALHLARYLEQVGGRVFLTRNEDADLGDEKVDDLEARLNLAEEVGADLYISIHANSFPSPYEYGAQTFYWVNHPGSKSLAEEIQKSLVEGIDLLGYNYREIQAAEYYILRNLKIPAALVEVGFLSNPREEALLNNPSYHERLAWCIFAGIVRYFSLPDPGKEISPGERIS